MRVFPNLPLLVGELASLAKTETLNVQGCFTKGELVFFFRMFFFDTDCFLVDRWFLSPMFLFAIICRLVPRWTMQHEQSKSFDNFFIAMRT
jgi:hypothetical protein